MEAGCRVSLYFCPNTSLCGSMQNEMNPTLLAILANAHSRMRRLKLDWARLLGNQTLSRGTCTWTPLQSETKLEGESREKMTKNLSLTIMDTFNTAKN